MATVHKKGLSRLWVFDGGAGPTVTPQILAMAATGASEKQYGDVTPIRIPSSTQRGDYDTVDEFQSGEANATLSAMLRYTLEPSLMKKIADKKCLIDLQVHIGKCTDPRDFLHGWETGKIAVFENAHITTHGTSELGSMTPDDEGVTDENIDISARNYYEIGPMSFAERAKSEVTNEVIAVVVCDSPSCGDCDVPSDGCQKVYYVTSPAGTSPGLLPEVGVSVNGLTSIARETTITTAAIADTMTGAACIGDNLVVIDNTTPSLHYADLTDLQDGIATWTKITTGFVAAKGPNAIDSYDPFDTWIVGDGGYVYYTSDPTVGVTVQDAGVATTQNLKAVDAYTTQVVVAVGVSNSVVFTLNGGTTWASVVGPAVGVTLNTVAVRGEKEWWVGTADGKIYYTKDRGAHWTLSFTQTGAGNIYKIVWASNTVGFAAGANSTPAGRVYRTIDGGKQWKLEPDNTSTLPASNKISTLAVCKKDVNTLYGGGLATTTDGILLKGSTSYV
jgi:photosystem II stability/assembly factor-like uncharacterized protein